MVVNGSVPSARGQVANMVLLSIEGPTALQFGVQGSMREDAVCKCWALLEQGWKKREGRVGTGTSTKHLRAIGGSAGGGKSLKAWQMCHHIAR